MLELEFSSRFLVFPFHMTYYDIILNRWVVLSYREGVYIGASAWQHMATLAMYLSVSIMFSFFISTLYNVITVSCSGLRSADEQQGPYRPLLATAANPRSVLLLSVGGRFNCILPVPWVGWRDHVLGLLH